MAYQRNIYKGKKLSQMTTQEVSAAYNELNALRSKRTPDQSKEFFDLKKENTARLNAALRDTGPGAGAARIEEARAKEEPKEPNVFVGGVPYDEYLKQKETAKEEPTEQEPIEDIIRLGGLRDAAKDEYERSFWDKILYGKLGSTSATDAGTGEVKGTADDAAQLGGEAAVEGKREGESDFEYERRRSDEAARARQLAYREEDRKYFDQIEINKRLKEIEQRDADEKFYRDLRRKQYERESQERAEEQEDWAEIARAKEIQRQKEREEDSIYYEKVAEENRARELRERKEDEEYWDNIQNRRKEEKKEPTPSPAPKPKEPEEEVPIKDPETGRIFHVPSSLLFGLLKTSGYYEEFLKEEKKKKKK